MSVGEQKYSVKPSKPSDARLNVERAGNGQCRFQGVAVSEQSQPETSDNNVPELKDDDVIDLVIIGGGSAGLIAAKGAANVGASVVMVEPNPPGGDCLWTGCVPSKRILSAAHAAHDMRNAARHGIEAVEPKIDFAKVQAAIADSQEHISHHDSVETLEGLGAKVVPARGEFIGNGKIKAGDRVLKYRKAMIATGATPVVPGIPGLRESSPITSDSVWELKELPKRMVVIGGGAIGSELGQAFGRLGSEVTLIEALPRILAFVGPQVAEVVGEQMRSEGMTVLEGSKVTSVEGSTTDGTAVVIVDEETRIPCDAILVAVGRRPNTADMGLETVGVDLDERGHVVVSDTLQTSNSHIYAGGDVVGKAPFTHTAGHHGAAVMMNALFKIPRKIDHDKIPFAIFCDPEVASVGKIEGPEVEQHHFDYDQLDRAVTSGHPQGFIDLFTEKGKIVGATVVGVSAGETINELTHRVNEGHKLRSVAGMIRPYPTYGEAIAKAANGTLGEEFFTDRNKNIAGKVLDLLGKYDSAS